MTSPPVDAPAPATEYKRCATCGFATPATRARCHHCWNRLDDAPLLEADAAVSLLEAQGEFLDERAAQQRRRTLRKRLILGSIAAVLLAWVGWWFYSNYIYTPPPVPAPSTSIQMLSGPEVWATSGGDALGTRWTEATPPLDGAVAWTAAVGMEPSTPLVADAERVYAVLAGDRVVAVSRDDGSIAWEYDLSGSPLAAPTLADGRLYVGLRAGQLMALDPETGEELFFTLNTRTRFGTSPIIVDGVAYVFGIGSVFGFDAVTGEMLWSTENRAEFAFTNPVVTETHFAGMAGDEALVFSRENGEQTFFYAFPRGFPYSIASADGVIYASSPQFTVAFEDDSDRPWWEYWRATWNQFWLWGMAPDIPAPESLWQNNDSPDAGYPGVVDGGLLIIGGADGDLVAFDRETGEHAWRQALDPIVAPPLGTAGGLVVAHPDRLALYDPADGTLIAERPVDGEVVDVVVTASEMLLAYKDGRIVSIR